MDKQELIKKIVSKKEFSQLLEKDVEIVFGKFDREIYSDEEKIKITRNLLRKIYSAFVSNKILSLKNKNEEWILGKHISTRERFIYYLELYERLTKDFNKKISVIDLGCGVNGFSYKFFPEKFQIDYFGIEAVGQLVELTNYHLEKKKIKGKIFHLSLFEIEEVKKIIKNIRGEKIIFLFKIIDSLEMVERDYSKKLISEITPLADKIVISFATRSFIRKEKFKVRRNWILNFINENFKILDEFEIGGERYLVFRKN